MQSSIVMSGETESSAPHGWVSQGSDRKYSRPNRLHAVRDCIERSRNPRTGGHVAARPATQGEADRLPKCAHCYH
jgi:hypothetical protein